MQDDIRFRLCPPFFKLRGMRVDSPTSNNSDSYKKDSAFFKANPRRRLILRSAFMNEFDIDLELTNWLRLPILHCLVTQLSTGVHLLTPVYRGKAFFGDVTTDTEIAMIVGEMALRGGIDTPEFEAFEVAYNAKLKLTIAPPPEAIN